MNKRPLTPQEIATMEDLGCRAGDWGSIAVARDFSPLAFRNVSFSGDIELGRFAGTMEIEGEEGTLHPAGVYDARLHNVRIGDNCHIAHAELSDTDVGDGALVSRVLAVTRRGDKPFANNSPAHVLAEDGARAVPLSRHLTAQLAHLLCHLKGHPAGKALEDMIARDADALRSARSWIGPGCRVRRTGELHNVWLGEGARVEGAARLLDCYIDSRAAAATVVGDGVSAEDCVFLSGCRVEGGVRVAHCLVGEGVLLESDFFGKHSLFFANSTFALGEASCVMAGPFATSTHKASLVLTCQCSFNTFGSASNSSNHHFKLGPIHGGVLRRGTRCGSGSYIFWPSDIGAFTTVVGRHFENLETVDFPFSLLTAKNQTSILVPGVNLFSSGLYRDDIKWANRDRRKGVARPRDLVNAAIFSPYVMHAMEKGVLLLRRSEGIEVDLRHGGAVIPANRVKPALRLYDAALVLYVGQCLLARAMLSKPGGRPTTDDLIAAIDSVPRDGSDPSEGKWRDWGGMLLSGRDADAVLAELETGRLSDPEALRCRLEEIHGGYAANELRWAVRRWRREHGDADREQVVLFMEKWRRAVRFRHECIVRDIGKEFTQEVMYGFGVEDDACAAFRRVRGEPLDHPVLKMAREERDDLLELVDGIR